MFLTLLCECKTCFQSFCGCVLVRSLIILTGEEEVSIIHFSKDSTIEEHWLHPPER